MSVGPEDIQYGFDILEIVNACPVLSLLPERHSALTKGSAARVKLDVEELTITMLIALFCVDELLDAMVVKKEKSGLGVLILEVGEIDYKHGSDVPAEVVE